MNLRPKNKGKKLSHILNGNRKNYLLQLLQNAVVGYIHAADYDVVYAPHMKDIMGNRCFKSKFRRNGIGKALLCAVENWAKDTGACGVRLVTGETRTEAHAFYRHCGYNSNKTQLNFNKIF